MKKILIIRLSSIGDIVLTSPVLRCIKAQIPEVELHFAVKEQFLPVVASNPHIDRIHVFEGNLKSFTNQLKKEGFDYILDLHQNFRSWYIRFKLGIRSKGFRKLNFRKWLLTSFKIDIMPQVHVVDRYFEAARGLHIKNDQAGLDYFISMQDEYSLDELPQEFREGYIAFAIGAKHATKRLPVHKIISVCRLIDQPVVLLGGKEDAETGKEVVRESGAKVVSLCGFLNINQSASLVRGARVVITHDTGLMHIAAAFRKKIVSVWGNTVPAFGMAPYMPESPSSSVIVEVKGLRCRPCSKLGYERCPKKHFRCMEEISEEKIAGWLDR